MRGTPWTQGSGTLAAVCLLGVLVILDWWGQLLPVQAGAGVGAVTAPSLDVCVSLESKAPACNQEVVHSGLQVVIICNSKVLQCIEGAASWDKKGNR